MPHPGLAVAEGTQFGGKVSGKEIQVEIYTRMIKK